MKSYEAARILGEEQEQWFTRGKYLLLQSLEGRRLGRTPSPNGCTWIPGGGGPPCKGPALGERNFAGRAVAAPPPPVNDAYTDQNMTQFGVAEEGKTKMKSLETE
ncbi:hypothetical protein F511_09030 [Dorcoceras hygrometricum]|uniref:Uncharacterized protein n=1 Tax=Dorcoceras hygrometricum TaxID=472368 RepID=A0A2Z7AM91_9LAMI|nr:hypothetical protein F511_09030 [Dorcoceras hygrometricum]